VRTIEEVDFMIFTMPEQGGDDIEDKLRFVDGEEYSGDFMQWAVLDELHSGFHSAI
jgi:hypothetical protein